MFDRFGTFSPVVCSVLFFAVGLCALMMVSCESGAPTLDDPDISLTLIIDPNEILNLGDAALLRIRAIDASGDPIPEGTPVFLTTTGGFVPAQARLTDGEALVVFRSGFNTGTFTITATSGSITATTTITVSEPDPIVVGNVSVSANPTNLLEVGGPVTITVIVTDTDGEPIPQKRVLLSSDFGGFAGNGVVYLTDSQGIVRDTLRIPRLTPAPALVTVNAQVENTAYPVTITLTENQNPVPVILTSPDTLVVGEPVQFDGSTSDDPDGFIADNQFEWAFGDGGEAIGERVTHVFQEAGIWQVVLRVTDNLGASQTVTSPVTVLEESPNTAPTALFTFSPAAPRVGDPVSVNASQSSDDDGRIIRYSWDFGDSIGTGSGVTDQHIYSSSGDYNITLMVTDDEGATATSVLPVTITGNAAPVAALSFQPATVNVGVEVSFDASASTDADGVIDQYIFDFGDDSQEIGASPVATHTYTTEGTYIVWLTVVDDEDAVGFATATVTVGAEIVIDPPSASFTFTPVSPQVNRLVTFDASATTATSSTVVDRYSWNFGDGRFGSGREVTHAYRDPGDYTVTLTAFDNLDQFDQDVQVITVTSDTPPVPRLNVFENADGTLILDASGTTDAETASADLTYIFEVVTPDNVLIALTGEGSQRDGVVSVEDSQLTAFQLFFILTVIDADNNQESITEVFNYIVPGSATNEAPTARLTVFENTDGTITCDGSASTDTEDASSDLTYVFEATVPDGGAFVTLSGSGSSRTGTVTISNSQLTNFTIEVTLTVIDTDNNESVIVKELDYNVVIPP